MNVYEITNWLYDEINREITKFFKEATISPYGWYCYYKKGSILFTNQPAPIDYELAFPEKISPSMTADQIKRFVYNKLQSVPCLPD